MITEHNKSQNLVEVTIYLLRLLKTRITTGSIKSKLHQHPDFPSLLSISDVLKSLFIRNVGLKLDVQRIIKLETPFLAQLNEEKGNRIVVVKSIYNDNVIISGNGGRRDWKKLSLKDFTERATGLVMLIDASEQIEDPSFVKKRKDQIGAQLALFSLASLLLGIIGLEIWSLFSEVSSINVFSLFLLLVKFLGTVITVLLLLYEHQQVAPLLQGVCSMGQHTNCSAILRSKASKVFGGMVSWSEIGFLYFSFGALMLLCSGNNAYVVRALAIANIFALPYIAFSLYYQRFVIRQWCPLCLAVQGLLITEFCIGFSGHLYFINFISLPPVISLFEWGFIGMLPFFLYFVIKPLLSLQQNNEVKANTIARLKYNKRVFDTLLQHQDPIIEIKPDLGITLGNPQAKNKIVKVCNPFCNPCAKAHPFIEEMLRSEEDVQVQIIFSCNPSIDDDRAAVVKKMLAIQTIGDKSITRQALHDWYSAPVKKLEDFALKYDVDDTKDLFQCQMQEMAQWCALNKIEFTPTFYFNGFRLPSPYKIEDVKYFL